MSKRSLIISKTCLGAMFLALGWVLPFITGNIPEIGQMLCPMHIPVLLCGFILGPWYGLFIGFITPLTRGLLFGMPVIYPNGIAMAFELATYGFVSGILFRLFYKKFNLKIILSTYISLIIAMLVGRVIWGASKIVLGLVANTAFTWKLFMAGAFINAWPGIILQLILIPALIVALSSSRPIKRFICS